MKMARILDDEELALLPPSLIQEILEDILNYTNIPHSSQSVTSSTFTHSRSSSQPSPATESRRPYDITAKSSATSGSGTVERGKDHVFVPQSRTQGDQIKTPWDVTHKSGEKSLQNLEKHWTDQDDNHEEGARSSHLESSKRSSTVSNPSNLNASKSISSNCYSNAVQHDLRIEEPVVMAIPTVSSSNFIQAKDVTPLAVMPLGMKAPLLFGHESYVYGVDDRNKKVAASSKDPSCSIDKQKTEEKVSSVVKHEEVMKRRPHFSTVAELVDKRSACYTGCYFDSGNHQMSHSMIQEEDHYSRQEEVRESQGILDSSLSSKITQAKSRCCSETHSLSNADSRGWLDAIDSVRREEEKTKKQDFKSQDDRGTVPQDSEFGGCKTGEPVSKGESCSASSSTKTSSEIIDTLRELQKKGAFTKTISSKLLVTLADMLRAKRQSGKKGSKAVSTETGKGEIPDNQEVSQNPVNTGNGSSADSQTSDACGPANITVNHVQYNVYNTMNQVVLENPQTFHASTIQSSPDPFKQQQNSGSFSSGLNRSNASLPEGFESPLPTNKQHVQIVQDNKSEYALNAKIASVVPLTPVKSFENEPSDVAASFTGPPNSAWLHQGSYPYIKSVSKRPELSNFTNKNAAVSSRSVVDHLIQPHNDRNTVPKDSVLRYQPYPANPVMALPGYPSIQPNFKPSPDMSRCTDIHCNSMPSKSQSQLQRTSPANQSRVASDYTSPEFCQLNMEPSAAQHSRNMMPQDLQSQYPKFTLNQSSYQRSESTYPRMHERLYHVPHEAITPDFSCSRGSTHSSTISWSPYQDSNFSTISVTQPKYPMSSPNPMRSQSSFQSSTTISRTPKSTGRFHQSNSLGIAQTMYQSPIAPSPYPSSPVIPPSQCSNISQQSSSNPRVQPMYPRVPQSQYPKIAQSQHPKIAQGPYPMMSQSQYPRMLQLPYPRIPKTPTPQSLYPQMHQSPYPKMPPSSYPRMAQSPFPKMLQSPYPKMPQSPYPKMPQSPYPKMPQSPYPKMPQSPYPKMPQSPHPRMLRSSCPLTPQSSSLMVPQTILPRILKASNPVVPGTTYTEIPQTLHQTIFPRISPRTSSDTQPFARNLQVTNPQLQASSDAIMLQSPHCGSQKTPNLATSMPVQPRTCVTPNPVAAQSPHPPIQTVKHLQANSMVQHVNNSVPHQPSACEAFRTLPTSSQHPASLSHPNAFRSSLATHSPNYPRVRNPLATYVPSNLDSPQSNVLIGQQLTNAMTTCPKEHPPTSHLEDLRVGSYIQAMQPLPTTLVVQEANSNRLPGDTFNVPSCDRIGMNVVSKSAATVIKTLPVVQTERERSDLNLGYKNLKRIGCSQKSQPVKLTQSTSKVCQTNRSPLFATIPLTMVQPSQGQTLNQSCAKIEVETSDIQVSLPSSHRSGATCSVVYSTGMTTSTGTVTNHMISPRPVNRSVNALSVSTTNSVDSAVPIDPVFQTSKVVGSSGVVLSTVSTNQKKEIAPRTMNIPISTSPSIATNTFPANNSKQNSGCKQALSSVGSATSPSPGCLTKVANLWNYPGHMWLRGPDGFTIPVIPLYQVLPTNAQAQVSQVPSSAPNIDSLSSRVEQEDPVQEKSTQQKTFPENLASTSKQKDSVANAGPVQCSTCDVPPQNISHMKGSAPREVHDDHNKDTTDRQKCGYQMKESDVAKFHFHFLHIVMGVWCKMKMDESRAGIYIETSTVESAMEKSTAEITMVNTKEDSFEKLTMESSMEKSTSEISMAKSTADISMAKSTADIYMAKSTADIYMAKSTADISMAKSTSEISMEKSTAEISMEKNISEIKKHSKHNVPGTSKVENVIGKNKKHFQNDSEGHDSPRVRSLDCFLPQIDVIDRQQETDYYDGIRNEVDSFTTSSVCESSIEENSSRILWNCSENEVETVVSACGSDSKDDADCLDPEEYGELDDFQNARSMQVMDFVEKGEQVQKGHSVQKGRLVRRDHEVQIDNPALKDESEEILQNQLMDGVSKTNVRKRNYRRSMNESQEQSSILNNPEIFQKCSCLKDDDCYCLTVQNVKRLVKAGERGRCGILLEKFLSDEKMQTPLVEEAREENKACAAENLSDYEEGSRDQKDWRRDKGERRGDFEVRDDECEKEHEEEWICVDNEDEPEEWTVEEESYENDGRIKEWKKKDTPDELLEEHGLKRKSRRIDSSPFESVEEESPICGENVEKRKSDDRVSEDENVEERKSEDRVSEDENVLNDEIAEGIESAMNEENQKMCAIKRKVTVDYFSLCKDALRQEVSHYIPELKRLKTLHEKDQEPLDLSWKSVVVKEEKDKVEDDEDEGKDGDGRKEEEDGDVGKDGERRKEEDENMKTEGRKEMKDDKNREGRKEEEDYTEGEGEEKKKYGNIIKDRKGRAKDNKDSKDNINGKTCEEIITEKENEESMKHFGNMEVHEELGETIEVKEEKKLDAVENEKESVQRWHAFQSTSLQKLSGFPDGYGLPDPSSYMCKVCGVTIHNLKRLRDHLHLHMHLTPYKCRQCKHRCSTTGGIMQHIKHHHPLLVCSPRMRQKTLVEKDVDLPIIYENYYMINPQPTNMPEPIIPHDTGIENEQPLDLSASSQKFHPVPRSFSFFRSSMFPGISWSPGMTGLGTAPVTEVTKKDGEDVTGSKSRGRRLLPIRLMIKEGAIEVAKDGSKVGRDLGVMEGDMYDSKGEGGHGDDIKGVEQGQVKGTGNDGIRREDLDDSLEESEVEEGGKETGEESSIKATEGIVKIEVQDDDTTGFRKETKRAANEGSIKVEEDEAKEKRRSVTKIGEKTEIKKANRKVGKEDSKEGIIHGITEQAVGDKRRINSMAEEEEIIPAAGFVIRGKRRGFHTMTRTPYRCILCGQLFQSYYRTKEHLNVHFHNKTFTCKVCKHTTCSAMGIRRHFVERHRFHKNIRLSEAYTNTFPDFYTKYLQKL